MRSDVARWLAVVLIAPLLMLGSFNRATFLAHGHDDHGMHLHQVGALDGREFAVEDHHDDHGHNHAVLPSEAPTDVEPDDDELAEVPDGVIISFDDHKQLPTRNIDLGNALSPAVIFAVVAFALPTSPDLDLHVGSPGGALSRGPMDLMALRAGDRIVRTSRALLI